MLDLAQNGFGIIRDRSVAQVQIDDRNNVAENGIDEISVRSALLVLRLRRFEVCKLFHFSFWWRRLVHPAMAVGLKVLSSWTTT